MTLKNLILLAVAGSLVLSQAAVGQAQPAAASSGASGASVASSPQPPEVQEPNGQGESGMLSGDKPFTLMVDPEVGELNYIFDENRELESIQAKRGVIFSSEDMTLNSDEFEYRTLNSQLLATGKRVVVRLGDIIVTCQLFRYNPDTQEGKFSGNPVVYSRDREGKTRTTSGKEISILNVNGKIQMKVTSGGGFSPYIRSAGENSPLPIENTQQLPGQKNAVISLDQNQAQPANALNVSPRSTPAAGGTTETSRLLPIPGAGGAAGEAAGRNATPRKNRIDPNNPDDVKSLSTNDRQKSN